MRDKIYDSSGVHALQAVRSALRFLAYALALGPVLLTQHLGGGLFELLLYAICSIPGFGLLYILIKLIEPAITITQAAHFLLLEKESGLYAKAGDTRFND